MKNFKKTKYQYSHRREGDLVKIEIRDSTRRIIDRTKFNIKDKNSFLSALIMLEKYSGFSIPEIIREKMKTDEWW